MQASLVCRRVAHPSPAAHARMPRGHGVLFTCQGQGPLSGQQASKPCSDADMHYPESGPLLHGERRSPRLLQGQARAASSQVAFQRSPASRCLQSKTVEVCPLPALPRKPAWRCVSCVKHPRTSARVCVCVYYACTRQAQLMHFSMMQ